MINKNQYKNNYVCDNPSVRQSLFSTLETVKSQVEYLDFAKQKYNANTKTYQVIPNSINPQIDEICLIIAEMFMLNPDNEIKISGSVMLVGLVQEVYKKIRHKHVELVVENFNSITTIIHNKKAYLRTALYNSVFEFDAHYTNQVKHDMSC